MTKDLTNCQALLAQKELQLQKQKQNHQQIEDLLASDSRVKELQDAVLKLSQSFLFQRTEDITANERKLLQAFFGEHVLYSSQVRMKMVGYRQLISFFLQDVVLSLFKLQEQLALKMAKRRPLQTPVKSATSFVEQT